MEKKYTVTYKVSPKDTPYVYQADKNGHKAGEIDRSRGGHMWYVLSNKEKRKR